MSTISDPRAAKRTTIPKRRHEIYFWTNNFFWKLFSNKKLIKARFAQMEWMGL